MNLLRDYDVTGPTFTEGRRVRDGDEKIREFVFLRSVWKGPSSSHSNEDVCEQKRKKWVKLLQSAEGGLLGWFVQSTKHWGTVFPSCRQSFIHHDEVQYLRTWLSDLKRVNWSYQWMGRNNSLDFKTKHEAPKEDSWEQHCHPYGQTASLVRTISV